MSHLPVNTETDRVRTDSNPGSDQHPVWMNLQQTGSVGGDRLWSDGKPSEYTGHKSVVNL